MMKRSVFAASSMALFTAMPVYSGGYVAPAVEQPVIVPVVAQAMTWEGGYVGAHLGYGKGSIEDVNNDEAAKHDTKGAIGGIQAGYNWQLPSNLVLGVEAELSAMNVKADWTDGPYYGTDKHKLGATVRGRVGYAMDNFLPYLHAGFAWAKNEHMIGCGEPAIWGSKCYSKDAFSRSASHSVTGYVVGAGFEYAVDQNWSVRGEYAYTNYGKNRLDLIDPNIDLDDPRNNRNFKSDHHSVKLGVNYRF